MINLAWDLYDGNTHRVQCAEILSISFLQNNALPQQLNITKEEAIKFYLDQLDNKFFGWVFVFYAEEFNNLGNKQIIGINQEDGLQNPFLKQNSFYALWAKAKNVKQNEFFYMGDVAISLESRSREIVFYKMMIKITQYFQRCGFIYGIVKGLKPINNEIFNKNDVIAIPENSEFKETQGKKQILYAGKKEFLSNTFQNLLIQAQPKL